MNIFVLDEDPVKAAQAHCDKHVVKMVLETAQLLCSAHHYALDEVIAETPSGNVSYLATRDKDLVPYKATHMNHPCAKWVREDMHNYNWLLALGEALCKEYTHRYGKIHKSQAVIEWCADMDIFSMPDEARTPFAQAMPDEYKNNDPVIAYRNYYAGEKGHMLAYTNRERPQWLNTS